MTAVRMGIAEGVSGAATAELAKKLIGMMRREEDLRIYGLGSFSVLSEAGGRMVILECRFESADACLQFHCSRAWRQIVAATQQLMVGDFVVKVFEEQL